MVTPRIFGRDPALWIQAIVAALTLFGALVLPLPDGATAAVSVALTAGASTWTALHVRPIAPTVFTGLVVSTVTLIGYFGIHATQVQVTAVTLTLSAFVTLVGNRPQQTPIEAPVPAPMVPLLRGLDVIPGVPAPLPAPTSYDPRHDE